MPRTASPLSELALALLLPASSLLSRAGGVGVPEGDRARADQGPLTPAPATFAIWGPIFAALVGYAGVNLRHPPEDRQDERARRAARRAIGFSLLWSLNAQLRGLGKTSVALIVASALYARRALFGFVRAGDDSAGGRSRTALFAPLAGWLTIAAVANVETTLNVENGRPRAGEEDARALALLAAGTAVAVRGAQRSGGHPGYAAAAAWGLGGIAVRNRREGNDRVAMGAALAAMTVIGAALISRRRG